ncbi:MAG: hypothetical protein Q7K26_02195 [bacterium]|nr:hypothetical protein [bacterium]
MTSTELVFNTVEIETGESVKVTDIKNHHLKKSHWIYVVEWTDGVHGQYSAKDFHKLFDQPTLIAPQRQLLSVPINPTDMMLVPFLELGATQDQARQAYKKNYAKFWNFKDNFFVKSALTSFRTY